jgi:23S rRNA G2445 N2-methylase RlmL
MKQIKIIAGGIFLLLLNTYSYASMQAEQFCFNDTVVKNETIVKSNVITVKNIDKPVSVEVKGRGEYSINGIDMKRQRAVVKDGDRIQLRHSSLDEDGAKVSTTLVIGEVYDVFTTVTNKGGKAQRMYRIDSSHCQR